MIQAEYIKKNVSKAISTTLFIIISMLVVLPVYFRGLYFEKEQFFMYLISTSLFLIMAFYKTYKKDAFRIGSLLDCGILALTCIYIISIMFAVNYRLAISESFKYINYYIIYLLVKELIYSSKQVRRLLNIIFISITGVAFIGIGAAIGTIQYSGAYSDAQNELWINSTLQYHNAFAALIMCGIFLCYALYIIDNKIWVRCLYSISGYMLLLAFVFSYSRGAWAVFTVMFAILLILLWERSLHDIISLTIAMIAPVTIISKSFRLATLEKAEISAWKSFIIGFLICIALNLFLQIAKTYMEKRGINIKSFTIIGMVLVVVMLIIIMFISPGIIIKLIPKDLLDRLKDINFSAGTVKERFVFYFDALDIVKDFPVFGAGGGAWQSLYFVYQSYLYWSTQAHSYIMQVWVETGTVGFIIVISMLGAFLKQSIINLKFHNKNEEIYIMQVGILIAAASLILHSFIDFDLSLSGISIILWALFALTSLLSRPIKSNKSVNVKVAPIYIIIPVTIMMIITISFMIARMYVDKGLTYVKEKETIKAVSMFEQAIKIDPLKSAYRYDYANMKYNTLSSKQREDNNIMNEVIKHIDAAIALDRYNSDMHVHVGGFYYRIGELEKGLELVNKAVKLQPLRPEKYQQMAYGYFRGAHRYIDMDQKDKARKLLNDLINLEERVENINVTKLKPVHLNEDTLDIIKQAEEMLEEL